MSQALFAIDEAARVLHCSKWSIYRLVSSGKLKNVRYNARTQFFEREEIERYARENGYRIEIPDQAPAV
jgi:excisionase family DNA binding protein